MTTDKLQLADLMRKTAKKLRAESKKMKKVHTVKCAQALIAVRGLAQLQDILRGVGQ